MSSFTNWIVAVLGVGIVACIVIAGTGLIPESPNALLSVVLCLLSIGVTYSVSHAHSKRSSEQAISQVRLDHQNSLRTYALNAAEKVDNLSNQLNAVATYLRYELDAADYDSAEHGLQALNERVTSAIQMIDMLKSINDTSLSDWKGVIGDELDQRREEREELTEKLFDCLERVEGSLSDLRNTHWRDGDEDVFQSELAGIHRSLAQLARSAASPLSPARGDKSAKGRVVTTCPECEARLEYQQRRRKSSTKSVTCKDCNIEFISSFSPTGEVRLTKRARIEETIRCPFCGMESVQLVDNWIGSSDHFQCEKCTGKFLVSRVKDGVRVKEKAQPPTKKLVIDEGVLSRVQDVLPEQPWPTKIHVQVAADIGISEKLASTAISQLIKQGVFKPQFAGRLYVPDDRQPSAPQQPRGATPIDVAPNT